MAQSQLSPGVSFVFESLRQLFIPISATVAATFGLSYVLSTPATYLLAALFCPGYICICRVWKYIVEERERVALGAIRVPVKTGKWPGGLDLLLDRLKAGKNGYPCTFIIYLQFCLLWSRKQLRTFHLSLESMVRPFPWRSWAKHGYAW